MYEDDEPWPITCPGCGQHFQQKVGWLKSEEEWAERAAAFLKHKIREAELTYADMAKRLKKHGLKETEASITNKLARGTFPATFFLACLAALELDGVALEEI
jgi:hypothetical protein